MPYIGLEEQGFYGPWRGFAAGIQGYQDKKKREREQGIQDRQLGLQEKEFSLKSSTADLQNQLLQRKLNPPKFDLNAVPKGYRPKSIDVDELGGHKVTLERDIQPIDLTQYGMKPKGARVSPEGETTLDWGPDIGVSKPPEIVELPLPHGGTGMFLSETNPQTGAVNYTPYTPRQATEKPVSDEALQKLNVTSLALNQLPEIEKLVTDSGSVGGPIAGRATQAWNSVFGPNADQLAFDSLRARYLAPLAKGILGETGVLSEADMRRYEPLLPSYTDTPAVRQQKVATLKKMVIGQRDAMLQNLKAGGRDVSGLESSPSLSVGQPQGSQQPLTRDQAAAEAQKALKRGVPRSEVEKRLREQGFGDIRL